MRRSLLRSAALLPLAGLAQGAGVELPPELVEPYRLARQPRAEDEGCVRAFFAFACPHCRALHESLWRWGASLPARLRYLPTPVVSESRGHLLGAHAYYAVLLADAQRLPSFMAAVYRLIHEGGQSAADWQLYAQALRDCGLAPQRFAAAWRSSAVSKEVLAAAALLPAYGVRATPTLAVGGKYLISPEVVNGDHELFLTLANAMVSRFLQEG